MPVLSQVLDVAKMRPFVKAFPDGLFRAVEGPPKQKRQNSEVAGQTARKQHFSSLSYGLTFYYAGYYAARNETTGRATCQHRMYAHRGRSPSASTGPTSLAEWVCWSAGLSTPPAPRP